MNSSLSLTEILQEPPISIAIAADEVAEAAALVAVPISMAVVDVAAMLIVVLPISMFANNLSNIKNLLMDNSDSDKKQFPSA